MSLPTLNDLHLVDPVLTNILVQYKQDATRFIASQLFPVVPVDKKGGTYPIYTKKYWFTDEMEVRVPGQPYARTGFGVSSSTYKTIQYALAVPIADESRAENQTPLDLEDAAVSFLAQKSLIRKERAFAADFLTTSVWETDDTTATDWDDFTSGDPVANVLTAVRTISLSTGYQANTLAVGHIVHEALINHPDIIDRIKYVQIPTARATQEALAALFGLERYLVGMAAYNSANEGQDASQTAIFDDDALVCYVNPAPSILKPSAGYTFAWGPGGGAGVIINTRDDENDADLIKNKEQWDQKVVATDLGYFFSDIV